MVLDDAPSWKIEEDTRPRTIADHGGTLVLAAALCAALVAAWLLYLP